MRNFRRRPRPRDALLVLGIAYPFLVYFGLGRVSPLVLALALLAMVAAQIALGRRRGQERAWIAPVPWLVGAVVVALLLARSPLAALQSYPILLSLGLFCVFGYSLVRPPTVVERIARWREPDLPPDAIPYLRGVTLVWLAFFLVNAAVSAATALSGSLELWTLYNGFLSYLIMGALFAGELVVRRCRRPGVQA